MSLRIDTAELISGAYVIGETGLGVLGSAVPSTGEHGASYLYNDLSLPADDGKEIRGLIVTPPSDGTFYAWEDGSFSLIGAADGEYTFVYRLFVDGVDGGTATATITIGDGLTGAAVLAGITAAGSMSSDVPTIGRPASDTSQGAWAASTGSDLYAMINEVTPDAANYIVTTATGSICEMPLQTTEWPGTSAQVLSYRASSSTGNSVIVRLKNTGGATVRTETQVLTSTDTLYEITLTALEIAAITSGALSVELESA